MTTMVLYSELFNKEKASSNDEKSPNTISLSSNI